MTDRVRIMLGSTGRVSMRTRGRSGDETPLLEFLCITMPRWPGDQEATLVEGPWTSTAPDG